MNPDQNSIVELDVRGLSCPEPVLRTRRALDSVSCGIVAVRTDSAAARDNIIRYGEKAGCRVSSQEFGPGQYVVHLEKAAGSTRAPETAAAGTVVVLTADCVGRGSDELGRLMAGLLLRTLAESQSKPEYLLLMNGGVRLAVTGSDALSSLHALEQQGTEVRVCGTCLDFFGINSQVQAGVITNLFEAVDIMMSAARVISF
jgi:selenium metabolism protein YedF